MGEKFIRGQLDKADQIRANAVQTNKNIIEDIKRNVGAVKVSGRIKEANSMVGKLARKPDEYNDVADLYDVSGIRAMAKNLGDVQDTMDYVRDNYNIISEKNNIDEDRGGYRSYHAIVEKDGIKSEIQIRTKRQDTWANWAHDNFYKPATPKLRKFLIKNKESINNYSLGMSNYFYQKDQGQNADKPECPKIILKVVGCL